MSPPNTKNKLREKQNRKKNKHFYKCTHTDPRIEVFCDSSWCERPLAGKGHLGPSREGASRENFPTFLTTEKNKQRLNLTVVAENVCPVVTRLFENN